MIALLAEIERILLREWDPIGVQDFAGVSDEYDSYAFQIYVMLKARTPASVHEIAAYLNGVQTEHMGLALTASHNEAVAEAILRMHGR